MNTSPMALFTHGLLPSFTTPIGPAIDLTRNPRPVKKTMTPTQKTTACMMPSRRLPVCRFRKYDTVNGIMGKTQGVKIAASPAPKAVSKNKPKSADCGAGVVMGAGVEAVDVAAAPDAGLTGTSV